MSGARRPAVRAIHRYAVKGLAAEELGRARLRIGRGIEHDRRWGISDGKPPEDPDDRSAAKRFLTVREHGGFTQITASVTEDGRLVFRLADGTAILDEPADSPGLGKAAGDAIGDRLGLSGLELVDHSASPLWDYPGAFFSLINLASVRDLSEKAGAELDVRRFRGNVILECHEPWAEIGWVGRDIRIGPDVALRVVREIPRCVATCVNPGTSERDVPVPLRLKEHYGHANFGVLAAPIAEGVLSVGDEVGDEQAVWKS